MRTIPIVKSVLQRLKSVLKKSLRSAPSSPRPRSLLVANGRSLIKLGSVLALPLLCSAWPAWALTRVARPELRDLKRAAIVRVVDNNTLVVQLEGDLDLRLVQLIGIDPLPAEINPTWTELRRQTPLAVYNAGQYLQTALLGREVFLELDPALAPAPTLPAYVWQANTLINQEMLFLGHGLLSGRTDGLKYGPILREAATAARQQGRGYWTSYGPR
ncbi:thermonuclease family protein [Synechococcus sp. H55.10]|uniref:thermonuclease family protein n=1 Tax=Synechococcus sp. H55.10 TaxID=2964503 RepID=UPI0039C6E4AA